MFVQVVKTPLKSKLKVEFSIYFLIFIFIIIIIIIIITIIIIILLSLKYVVIWFSVFALLSSWELLSHAQKQLLNVYSREHYDFFVSNEDFVLEAILCPLYSAELERSRISADCQQKVIFIRAWYSSEIWNSNFSWRTEERARWNNLLAWTWLIPYKSIVAISPVATKYSRYTQGYTMTTLLLDLAPRVGSHYLVKWGPIYLPLLRISCNTQNIQSV